MYAHVCTLESKFSTACPCLPQQNKCGPKLAESARGPSDVMPVTGKARKLSETEKHHHEDTWLWLKNDSPLRIQNDTYYDICLINMS